MNEPTIEALAGRLGRLERECRRWRRAGAIVAVLGLAAMLMGGSREDDGPGTIEARRFLLKDNGGTTRGEWGFTDKSDWPFFRLYDKDGGFCLTLMAINVGKDPGSPVIMLHGRDRVSRLMMTVLRDGSPMLDFSDKDGKPTLRLPEVMQGPPPIPPQPVPDAAAPDAAPAPRSTEPKGF